MLTRLCVSGFKNLVDVDVRFGPFTCLVGPNGVGKSNLFDAIGFLSALADLPLLEAALTVRGVDRAGEVGNLFHGAAGEAGRQLSLAAEMIVPATGVDDLGQAGAASITFVRYAVTIAWRAHEGTGHSPGPLELVSEDLDRIKMRDARELLLFPHANEWRRSVIMGRRLSPLISTAGDGADRVIKRHQDGISGRTLSRLAANLPRTVLSVSTAAEAPTALMARRELQSWRQLQLEPSALRRPDEFTAPPVFGRNGAHLAATLYHLAHPGGRRAGTTATPPAAEVYAALAARLGTLGDAIAELNVDRDEARELLALEVTTLEGTRLPASALSDGTLRFLALALLEQDPQSPRVLCLEEPENGIPPDRLPGLLQLLRHLAVDPHTAVGPANPLRQVLINTHSPVLIAQVADDDLLVAESAAGAVGGRPYRKLCLRCLADTWRTRTPGPVNAVSRASLNAGLQLAGQAAVRAAARGAAATRTQQLGLPLFEGPRG